MDVRVLTTPNTEFCGEDFVLKVDGALSCFGTRYDKKGNEGGYSTVSWMVCPHKTKEDYVHELARFYEALKRGNFDERGKRGLSVGIRIDYVTEYPLLSSLEYLTEKSTRRKFLASPQFSDFRLLRFDTPYAAFTMEDFSGSASWSPQTGYLCAISHNDISLQVAALMANTARSRIPKEALQMILSDTAYTFREEVPTQPPPSP